MICQRYWLFHDFEQVEGIGSAPSSPMPMMEVFDSVPAISLEPAMEPTEAMEELVPV
jgi:hypothetical protein